MGTQERRERERKETRTKILDAARDLFAEHGYEAVSMRRIAEAIEYSPTAIYVHFKDKEALFHELCRHDFGQLAHVFAKIIEVKDPIERIGQLGHAYMRFALERPNQYRLMFMTPKLPPSPEQVMEQTKGDPAEDGYAVLKLAVVEGLQAGRFRPELTDADLIAQTFWAAVHGVVSLRITMHNDPWIEWADIDLRMRTMVDGILRGMTRGDGKGKE